MNSLLKHVGIAALAALCAACTANPDKNLADIIKNDHSLAVVDSMGRALLARGLNAGSGYSQVWARDMNTFVETACEVVPPEDIKGAIRVFFALQQPNGEMIDGYVLKGEFDWEDPNRYYSDAAPEHVAFKNTVETDQETSLIQIVWKYIQKTGDKSILQEQVAGRTVYERMKEMVDYLMREKYNTQYGLLTGALTADWGDVQPDEDNLCDITENSIVTIDAYDNAMFAIALGDCLYSALGDKAGIGRYGFSLPMDEAEATVLIDLGGRIDFQWNVNFRGGHVGDVSVQMFSHFFKSLSEHLKCNLHIKACGQNDHHVIEGVFKAFARALKQAVARIPDSHDVPSSKGRL